MNWSNSLIPPNRGIRLLIGATLIALLCACGSGVDTSIPTTNAEKYYASLNDAFKEMNNAQQEAFNRYARRLTIVQIHNKYGTMTPRELVEGEALENISSSKSVVDKVLLDYPIALQIEGVFKKLNISEPNIDFFTKDGEEQARVSFLLENRSSNVFSCFDSGNFIESFAEALAGSLLQIEVGVTAKDGDSIQWTMDGKKSLCENLPRPGTKVSLSLEHKMGSVTDNLLSVQKSKRVGLSKISVRIFPYLNPNAQQVPSKVFQQYLASKWEIQSAKRDIAVIRSDPFSTQDEFIGASGEPFVMAK